tara:strand:- start:86 stop:571 length:486 start_codon:yes stop_codon:yes gene_type:complete
MFLYEFQKIKTNQISNCLLSKVKKQMVYIHSVLKINMDDILDMIQIVIDCRKKESHKVIYLNLEANGYFQDRMIDLTQQLTSLRKISNNINKSVFNFYHKQITEQILNLSKTKMRHPQMTHNFEFQLWQWLEHIFLIGHDRLTLDNITGNLLNMNNFQNQI